ncbi:MAG: flagellar hook assembly protein FlgD [Burkholderiaceae bacterium]
MAVDTLASLKQPTSSSTATATKKTDDATDVSATQDKFLKMLVAQMQNQDPLNPMDNAAVTSQMAQLNTVSGIQNLNTTMQTMATAFSGGQAVQATSMLGRTVMLEGNKINLQGGRGVAAVDLGQAADQVSVEVKDSTGKVVHTAGLGALPSGLHEITWDGKADDGSVAADGAYTFDIKARAAGSDAKFMALSIAKVQGVTQAADGVHLLTDSSGDLKMSDVKKIF